MIKTEKHYPILSKNVSRLDYFQIFQLAKAGSTLGINTKLL